MKRSLPAAFQHPAFPAAAIAAAIVLATLGLRASGALQRYELDAYDHFTRQVWHGPAEDPRVALVLVTEEDIQRRGEWPLSDATLEKVLEALATVQARAVAVDIYRDMPVPPGTKELDARLRQTPNLAWLSLVPDAGQPGVGPPPALAEEGKHDRQVGFNNMVSDPDGITRRALVFLNHRDEVLFALPLQAALLYLGDEAGFGPDPERADLPRLGATTLEPLSSGFGGYVGIDAAGFQMPLDLRGAAKSYATATLEQVLSPDGAPAVLRDRLVFVGVGAQSVRDPFYVPIEREGGVERPGVEVQADVASYLLRLAKGEQTPLRASSELADIGLVALAALAGASAGLWTRSARTLLALSALVGGGLWLLGREALAAGVWVAVVPPAISWTASVGSISTYLSRRERRERAQLMQLFSRHVTPALAEEFWRHRDEFLEGRRPRSQRMTVTTMFIDMKGYTTMSEKRDPTELMQWIDEFLSHMAQIVHDHGGVVEDFFGDGMMSLFGVPRPRQHPDEIERDARNAVVAALEMRAMVRRLNEGWRQRDLPSVGARVGISTGLVVAGSLGSATRIKYSVVGDAVVTAQRLESLDDSRHAFDQDPCRILINEPTRRCLDSTFVVEELGEFLLKGKQTPIAVYRVLGRADPVTR
ncbi:MAG TPA: adenylate/guanylate cyclase domain-containing protein [Myxococcota bacterium]|nr:adenylate/guanylate cyclase domain-containing protein [Myxococcota bacterium]